MPRMPFGINVSFSGDTLRVVLRTGLMHIAATPHVQASILRLQMDRWTECFPRLPLDRILQLLDANATASDGRAHDDVTAVIIPSFHESRESQVADAYREFCRAVGMELCRTASQLGCLHFTALYFATRVPALIQRMKVNPGLMFALVMSAAHAERNTGSGLQLLQAMADRKEASIATKLRFPPGTWRILKRVTPAALRPHRMKRFRNALWSAERARIARHLPQLGVNVLELLSADYVRDRRPALNRISHRLLHELAEMESPTGREPLIAQRISAILMSHDLLFPKQPLHVASLEHVDRLYERYLDVIEPDDLKRSCGGMMTRFPSPPIPGDECFTPLRTAKELLRESILQTNCCCSGHYLRSIMRRRRYFYRVDGGGFDRLTVELVQEEQGDRPIWRLGEVRGPKNRFPHRPRTTFDCLATWLADYQRVADECVLPVYHPLAYDHAKYETEEESEGPIEKGTMYPLFDQ